MGSRERTQSVDCISAPFGGIGGLPLMSTPDASRAGQFVAQFPEALARQWLTSRGADQAERGACCAPDKPVFSVCVCAVFAWCRLLAQVACWGEPARHCGPPVPIGRTGFAWLQCKYVLTFTRKNRAKCGPGSTWSSRRYTPACDRESSLEGRSPHSPRKTVGASGVHQPLLDRAHDPIVFVVRRFANRL